jgi:hypothetical protein
MVLSLILLLFCVISLVGLARADHLGIQVLFALWAVTSLAVFAINLNDIGQRR